MPLLDPKKTAEELICSQNTFKREGIVVSYQFGLEPFNPRSLNVHEFLVDTAISQVIDEREVSFNQWVRELAKIGNQDVTFADCYELEKRIGVALLEGFANG